jgi:ribosome-associated protein
VIKCVISKVFIKAIMLTDEQALSILKRETDYQTSRSGGKGGQNVNKVETKVEIEFDVAASVILSAAQKEIILKKYPGFVGDSFIKLTVSKHRSQLENKEEAQNKLILLLNKLLKPSKKRLATKPSKASKRKKMEGKKRNSEKKSMRQKPG